MDRGVRVRTPPRGLNRGDAVGLWLKLVEEKKRCGPQFHLHGSEALVAPDRPKPKPEPEHRQ